MTILFLQVTSLQQQLTDAREENRELLSKMCDWGVSSAPLPDASPYDVGGVTSTTRSTADEKQDPLLLPDRTELEREIACARSRAEASEAEVAELRALMTKEREKVRSDQIILAKEIKKLRAELSAAIKVQ